jgi:hypothetical protein
MKEYIFKVKGARERAEIVAESYEQAERVLNRCINRSGRKNPAYSYLGTQEKQMFNLPSYRSIQKDKKKWNG